MVFDNFSRFTPPFSVRLRRIFFRGGFLCRRKAAAETILGFSCPPPQATGNLSGQVSFL